MFDVELPLLLNQKRENHNNALEDHIWPIRQVEKSKLEIVWQITKWTDELSIKYTHYSLFLK